MADADSTGGDGQGAAWLGAGAGLLSALGGLFGGGKDGVSRDDQRWMNDFAWKQSLRNEEFQHQLAEHGLSMRVRDAESAGLHPLVGAGINPASGGWSGPAFASGSGSRSRGSHPLEVAGSMGQSISRAWAATASQDNKLEKAAYIASLQASTAESNARRALAERELVELGKTPPIPKKYIQVVNEHGELETIFNPDVAQGMMADPLGSWGNSFRKSFGGPDTYPQHQMRSRNRTNRRGYSGYQY